MSEYSALILKIYTTKNQSCLLIIPLFNSTSAINLKEEKKLYVKEDQILTHKSKIKFKNGANKIIFKKIPVGSEGRKTVYFIGTRDIRALDVFQPDLETVGVTYTRPKTDITSSRGKNTPQRILLVGIFHP